MQEESFLVRLGEVRYAGNGTVKLRFSRNIGTETENVLFALHCTLEVQS